MRSISISKIAGSVYTSRRTRSGSTKAERLGTRSCSISDSLERKLTGEKPITRAPEVAFQTLSWDNQFVDVVLVIHGDTSGGPRLGAVEFNLNRGSFRSLENRPCVDK